MKLRVLDYCRPEILDCTARTGLDMLAKHYYQSASAWVVFFVPESDADIGYYNEFMHYLGEKQRAAVAKLDEKTTLFLVPPSEFSENVLKVPGKLSISGVILKLEQPGSSLGSNYHPHDKKDMNFTSFQGDILPPYSNPGKSEVNSIPISGNMPTAAPHASFPGSAQGIGGISEPNNLNRHDYVLHQRNPPVGPNRSPRHLQNSNSSSVNLASHAPYSAADPIIHGHNFVMPRSHETSSSSYSAGILGNPIAGSSKLHLQETKPPVSSSMPVAALQPEQLAQLASSLLGQQRQPGSSQAFSMGEDFRRSSTINQSDNSYRTSQSYNNQGSSELSTSQFDQVQPLLQQQHVSNVPVMPPREVQTGTQGNQQLQNTGMQDDVDADPQKRLQATLQLAAALLQQIQQGKGT